MKNERQFGFCDLVRDVEYQLECLFLLNFEEQNFEGPSCLPSALRKQNKTVKQQESYHAACRKQIPNDHLRIK